MDCKSSSSIHLLTNLCFLSSSIHQKELAEASEYLIQTIYGFQSSLIEVTCQIEVSEQHQMYLQTREQTKDLSIASIEEYTHTTIRFPTVINQGSGRRTSVIITGKANQVCLARKLFDVSRYALRLGAKRFFLLVVFTDYFDI